MRNLRFIEKQLACVSSLRYRSRRLLFSVLRSGSERDFSSKDFQVSFEKASRKDVIDVGRLDFRVGRVVEATKHPDADSLYIEHIDVGEAKPRTVISGLVKFVPLSQMVNRLVVCLCNVKPVRMRSVYSEAMLMCAATEDKVEILDVDKESIPGQRLLCDNFPARPDAMLDLRKRVWTTVAADLRVDCEGKFVYKGHSLLVDGRTPVTAATLRNVLVR